MHYCVNHPEEPAILISGRSYCAACTKRIEGQVLVRWMGNRFHITPDEADKRLTALFGTEEYSFMEFSRLYRLLPHEWIEKEKRFRVSQYDYLFQCYDEFMNTMRS